MVPTAWIYSIQFGFWPPPLHQHLHPHSTYHLGSRIYPLPPDLHWLQYPHLYDLCRTQKLCKKSPSVHHRTTLLGYIFVTKAHIVNWKKPVEQQYLLHMFSQYVKRWPTNGWDRFRSLGHPSIFNGFHILALLLHWHCSMEVNQTLHDVWPSPGLVHYIYVFGALTPNRILPGAKFTLHPSLAFSYTGSITVRHSSSGRQKNFVVWYIYATGQPSRLTMGGLTV